jgi:hypothetical protein
MAKTRKPKKAAKKAAVKRQSLAKAKGAGGYCYKMTPDPAWIERCEYNRDDRCNVHCVFIRASQLPKRAETRPRPGGQLAGKQARRLARHLSALRES